MHRTMERIGQKLNHEELWQKLPELSVDVLVIGGGITGAGIAAEAAKLGQRVLLVERQDFAWGTSSRSSKMVHGGLRYLAQGDYKTTRDSVRERERLLKESEGLVELMNYAMPHYQKQFPPSFLFKAVLWLYDFFAGKRYQHALSKEQFCEENPYLKTHQLLGATQFSDAVTDDSRLVMRVLNEAQQLGAWLLNYVGVETLIRVDQQVKGVRLRNYLTDERCEVQAKVVINATGVWVDELRQQLGRPSKIRPSRGSHVILKSSRLPVPHALMLLHPEDKRPVFVYPWDGRTVIGTTDIDHGRIDHQEARISTEELNYLFTLVKHYFPNLELSRTDVISSFSGVRPLIASGALNPSKEKRHHSVWNENGLISVSGGKLTTYRLIALDALKSAKLIQNKVVSDSVSAPLLDFSGSLQDADEGFKKRLQGYYGHVLQPLVDNAPMAEWNTIDDTPLTWAELRFSARCEFVQHLDDLLLRRSRLGLLLGQEIGKYKDPIQRICQEELAWSDEQWQHEWQRYQNIFQQFYCLPDE